MRRAVAALSALVLLSGCELLNSLQNRKLLGAVIIATPGLASTQAAGSARGFPALVAQVRAQVLFADRQDEVSSGGSHATPPRGIAGATVTVTWRDATGAEHTLPLAPTAADGRYLAGGADGLAYVAGSTYRFDVEYAGDRYSASVVAPQRARVDEFPPERLITPESYADFPGQTLTFQRSGDDLAFYSVYAVPAGATRATLESVTCTNFPLTAEGDPSGLMNLLLDASRWRKSRYTLLKTSPIAEESCFAQGPSQDAPASYIVALGLGRMGSFSDNLFTGSVAFAGALDDAALVFTR